MRQLHMPNVFEAQWRRKKVHENTQKMEQQQCESKSTGNPL